MVWPLMVGPKWSHHEGNTFSTGQALAVMAGPKWGRLGSDTFFRRIHCVLPWGARSGSAADLFDWPNVGCHGWVEVGPLCGAGFYDWPKADCHGGAEVGPP